MVDSRFSKAEESENGLPTTTTPGVHCLQSAPLFSKAAINDSLSSLSALLPPRPHPTPPHLTPTTASYPCPLPRRQVYKLRNEKDVYKGQYPERVQLLKNMGFEWEHSAVADEWDQIITGKVTPCAFCMMSAIPRLWHAVPYPTEPRE